MIFYFENFILFLICFLKTKLQNFIITRILIKLFLSLLFLVPCIKFLEQYKILLILNTSFYLDIFAKIFAFFGDILLEIPPIHVIDVKNSFFSGTIFFLVSNSFYFISNIISNKIFCDNLILNFIFLLLFSYLLSKILYYLIFESRNHSILAYQSLDRELLNFISFIYMIFLHMMIISSFLLAMVENSYFKRFTLHFIMYMADINIIWNIVRKKNKITRVEKIIKSLFMFGYYYSQINL